MVLPVLLAIVTSAITSLGFLAMVLRTTELNYKIWAEVASMRRFLDRAEGLLARMLLEPPPPAALLLDPAPPPVPTDLPKWIRFYRPLSTIPTPGDGFAIVLSFVMLAIPLLAYRHLRCWPGAPPVPEDSPDAHARRHEDFVEMVMEQTTPFRVLVLEQIEALEALEQLRAHELYACQCGPPHDEGQVHVMVDAVRMDASEALADDDSK